MSGERQTEPHQADRPRVSDITPAWMNYADSLEVELARVRAEKVTDGMGHVWTEESDLDRLDELEAEAVRLRAERDEAVAHLAEIRDARAPFHLTRTEMWGRLEAAEEIARTEWQRERARAEAAEARVAELEEQIGWTVQRCNAAIGDGFQGNANSAVAAVCDRLEGVQDRIDRAAAERTAERDEIRAALADLVALKDGPREDNYWASKDAAWQNARDLLREFPVPTRTREANAAALDALADHPKPGKIGTREASDGD